MVYCHTRHCDNIAENHNIWFRMQWKWAKQRFIGLRLTPQCTVHSSLDSNIIHGVMRRWSETVQIACILNLTIIWIDEEKLVCRVVRCFCSHFKFSVTRWATVQCACSRLFRSLWRTMPRKWMNVVIITCYKTRTQLIYLLLLFVFHAAVSCGWRLHQLQIVRSNSLSVPWWNRFNRYQSPTSNITSGNGGRVGRVASNHRRYNTYNIHVCKLQTAVRGKTRLTCGHHRSPILQSAKISIFIIILKAKQKYQIYNDGRLWMHNREWWCPARIRRNAVHCSAFSFHMKKWFAKEEIKLILIAITIAALHCHCTDSSCFVLFFSSSASPSSLRVETLCKVQYDMHVRAASTYSISLFISIHSPNKAHKTTANVVVNCVFRARAHICCDSHAYEHWCNRDAVSQVRPEIFICIWFSTELFASESTMLIWLIVLLMPLSQWWMQFEFEWRLQWCPGRRLDAV